MLVQFEQLFCVFNADHAQSKAKARKETTKKHVVRAWVRVLVAKLCGIMKLVNGTNAEFFKSLYSSVAERQSCKLKVLGSIPSEGCLA